MKKNYKLIIIGGGLVGLSTAYNLVTNYNGYSTVKGEDILVLEKNKFLTIKAVVQAVLDNLDINILKNI